MPFTTQKSQRRLLIIALALAVAFVSVWIYREYRWEKRSWATIEATQAAFTPPPEFVQLGVERSGRACFLCPGVEPPTVVRIFATQVSPEEACRLLHASFRSWPAISHVVVRPGIRYDTDVGCHGIQGSIGRQYLTGGLERAFSGPQAFTVRIRVTALLAGF